MLQRVSRRPGNTMAGRLHSEVGTMLIDAPDDIARSLRHTPFVALLPRPGEIRLR